VQAKSKDDLNALWGRIPPHERSQALRDQMGALAIGFEQRAAASPEPERPWAAQGEPSGSEWVTAPIPQGDEVRPGEEETPPLDGMEQGEPETGGGDRG